MCAYKKGNDSTGHAERENRKDGGNVMGKIRESDLIMPAPRDGNASLWGRSERDNAAGVAVERVEEGGATGEVEMVSETWQGSVKRRCSRGQGNATVPYPKQRNLPAVGDDRRCVAA
jgi:hypothetical protein